MIDIPTSAKRLLETFRLGRERGEITPVSPIRAKEIAKKMTAALKTEVDDAEVREVIHYLRAKMKIPIGSSGEGYYLCTYKHEWVKTRTALLSRIKNQQESIYGPDEYWEKKEQLNLIPESLLNHPTVKEIEDKFEAEVIPQTERINAT